MRPKRDIEYFKNMLRRLFPAVEDGRINQSDYDELSVSISNLIELMKTLQATPNRYGIMHADAHKGNMLYYEGDISLIDFSFCAFGDYMFDLGICLSDMKEELQPAFFDGYQNLRELPDNCEQLIEGFFLGSMVGTFSFWVYNPAAQDVLVRKVPQIVKEFALKFNHGVHFWFS